MAVVKSHRILLPREELRRRDCRWRRRTPSLLAERERQLERDLHPHWSAVFRRRRKRPLLCGLQRLFVETVLGVEGLHEPGPLDLSGDTDDRLNDRGALDLRLHRVLRVERAWECPDVHRLDAGIAL